MDAVKATPRVWHAVGETRFVSSRGGSFVLISRILLANADGD